MSGRLNPTSFTISSSYVERLIQVAKMGRPFIGAGTGKTAIQGRSRQAEQNGRISNRRLLSLCFQPALSSDFAWRLAGEPLATACVSEDQRLQTDQQIGAQDQFPPPFNGGIIGQVVIGPARLVLDVLEAVRDPRPQTVQVPHFLAQLAGKIGHHKVDRTTPELLVSLLCCRH